MFGEVNEQRLDNLAKDLVIHQREFVAVICTTQTDLVPYSYLFHSYEIRPEHLETSKEEDLALRSSWV